MRLVNWLILRVQLFEMRKTHPEMAADIKRNLALGHQTAEAIRLATAEQAARMKSRAASNVEQG